MNYKTGKRYIAVFLALAMILSAVPLIALASSSPFAGGDGSSGNPYQVADQAQLDAVRDYLGSCFIQVDDITITSANWTPIGDAGVGTRFTGSYNGGGNKIKGLKIDITTPLNSSTMQGLFGVVGLGGVISNVHLENVDIDVAASTGQYESFIGGLAGESLGTISGCSVTGTLDAAAYDIAAGGLVGSVGGSQQIGSGVGSVTGCTSNCTLNIACTYQTAHAGGLAGEVFTTGSTISNCTSTGTVTCRGSSNTTQTSPTAGGLIGYIGGGTDSGIEVENCDTDCAVHALSARSQANAGGLIGCVSGKCIISGCSSTGNAEATGTTGAAGVQVDAGGLIGLSSLSSSVITNCHSSGNATASGTGTTSDDNFYSGGFLGYSKSGTISISQCYALGSAATTVNTYGYAFAGGFGGYFTNANVDKCYSKGNAQAVSAEGYASAGGFTGYYKGTGTMQNCFSMGNASADCVSRERAGGLSGVVESASVSHCYSTGIPSVARTTYLPQCGGLVGVNNAGTINGSFYDSTVSGKTDSDRGTPMASADMKNPDFVASLAGTGWKLVSNLNGGYPVLDSVGLGDVPTAAVTYKDSADTSTVYGTDTVAQDIAFSQPGWVNPSKPDSSLTGWYTDPSCASEFKWDFSAQTVSGTSHTLFAGWEAVAVPVLTAGTVSRTNDTAATVAFTTDTAGQYYYSVVSEGDAAPTLNTTGSGSACSVGITTITLGTLTAGAKDIYIQVKDASNHVSTALKVNIPAYIPPDLTAPYLTAGSVNRASDTSATVTFTSDEAGQYYFVVADAGVISALPYTGGAGISCTAGENSIALDTLTAGAKYILILVKDAAHNVSSALKIDIPVYDVTGPILTAGTVNRTGDTSATAAFTSNEAGQYYYEVVDDGATPEALNTGVTGVSCAAGGNSITLDTLTAGDKDIYIQVKDAAGNVSTVLKIDIPAYVPPDLTAPVLTAGTVNRTSDTNATVTFTSGEAGQYYYVVADAGVISALPYTGGAGISCTAGENSITLNTLTAGAKYILILVKDAAHNVSSALKIDILAYTDHTAPNLTAGSVSRTSDAGATVAFTTDEAGQYYYGVVSDGDAEPTLNTTGSGIACSLGEATITLGTLSAGAKDIYIQVKDATNNVSTALQIDIPAYVPLDGTAPTLTAGSVSRTSETGATVKFNTDESGQYYYGVVSDGDTAPTLNTTGSGIACSVGETTITLSSLTAGAKDIYIKVKDAVGNVSNALKMAIPAYDGIAPALIAGAVFRTSDTVATAAFTTDEAGEYYYGVVGDGEAEPNIDTGNPGITCSVGEVNITLGTLSAGAKDLYIKVRDAAGNFSTALKMDIPAFTTPDHTAPTLAAGVVNRISITNATVSFASDEAGEYYCGIVDDGSTAPQLDTTVAGVTCFSGETVIPLTNLTLGEKDIYIKIKDAAGNLSTALKMDIPNAFIPVTGILNVPASAAQGVDLTLSGTAVPAEATNQAIVWSLKNAGTTGATLSGTTLSTAGEGTVTVTATIAYGLSLTADYTQDFDIPVYIMSHNTLAEQVETSTVTAEGLIADTAQLIVVPIAQGDTDRAELEQQLTEQSAIAAYEVHMEPAEAFRPPLTLTFQVGDAYNGRTVYILHQLANGNTDVYTPTVANGNAVITVNELSPFLLAVDPQVTITAQPQSVLALVNQTATFHVEAEGLGSLSFRWQRRTGANAAWEDIAGAAGPDYTTSALNKSHNGYQYRVIVSDVLGNSTTSDAAVLTVTETPDTGDNSRPLLYAVMAVLFAAAVIIIMRKRRMA